MALTALQILQRDKDNAARYAERAGKTHARRLLERAQLELNQRLQKAEGLGGPGPDSFTAQQMRAVLAQVRAVLVPLQHGLQSAALDLGKDSAESGAGDALEYVQRAEQEYRGSARPIPFDTVAMVDQAVQGSNASVLRRLAGDPAHPARPGVLQRYGVGTIGLFEQAMQQRLIQGKSWDEARADLTNASPFLQGKPSFWAERILRTESMFQHNAAGQQTLEQVHDAVGGMLKILCATFDHRTGSDSIAVHGQVRRVAEAFQSWFGPYMHPPNRPNDREVVVPHNVSWPLPDSLKPRSDGDVAARWALEGRTGSPPPRPLMSTVDLGAAAQQDAPPMADQLAPPAVAVAAPAAAPPPVQEPPAEAYEGVDFQAGYDRGNQPGVEQYRSVSHAVFRRTLSPPELGKLLGLGVEAPGGVKPTATVYAQGLQRGEPELAASVFWDGPDGQRLGRMKREYSLGPDGKVEAHHAYIRVEAEHQQSGFGSSVVAQQLEQYPALGVSRVKLEAAWEGSYVWARAGFHCTDPQVWSLLRSRFAEHVRSIEGLTSTEAAVLSDPKSVNEMAQTRTSDGRQIGKFFLIDWGNAESNPLIPMALDVGSPEYDSALAYFRDKARGKKKP